MRDKRGRDYGAEDEEDVRDRMRFLKGAGLVLLAFVFAGALVMAYRSSIRTTATAGLTGGALPVIRADHTPYKMAPDTPGGVDIPHQDKEIYDRLSGTAEPGVERLLPRAEEPIDLSAQTQNNSPPPDPDALAAASAPAHAGASPMPAPGQPVPDPTAPVAAAPVTPTTPDTVAPPGTVPASEAEKKAEEALPEPIAEGEYVVQLGSAKDQAATLKQYGRLQKKFPALLGGLAPNIQRADLGDKGIFYRLRAGPLDKSAAELLCDKLTSQGQACLVKAK